MVFIGFFIVTFKSIVVIFMVGIRIVIVLKRSLNCGKNRVISAVSLVSIGMIDWLVVRVRRRLGWYVLIIC